MFRLILDKILCTTIYIYLLVNKNIAYSHRFILQIHIFTNIFVQNEIFSFNVNISTSGNISQDLQQKKTI